MGFIRFHITFIFVEFLQYLTRSVFPFIRGMIARSPGKIALQTRSFILLSFFSSIFFHLLNCSSLLVLASINLFNSKVFIIYLVRCYFLFGMKIILLSRGTMYVDVTIPDTYKWWNGDILNHGENHDFSYSTPTSIPVRVSMYITKTDRKKIIVVPFKYVFMFVLPFYRCTKWNEYRNTKVSNTEKRTPTNVPFLVIYLCQWCFSVFL